MVKSDKGEVRMKGTPNLISAEISMLLQQYRLVCIEELGEEVGMERFRKTVDIGCKTIEEIRAENEQFIKENPVMGFVIALRTNRDLRDV